MLTRPREHRVSKPWGRTDLLAPFGGANDDEPLGEVWFQRDSGPDDPLLVKYLFTSERLSVQVHPDDAAARTSGHQRGKDEAWLVLDAEPGAEIAIGLKAPLASKALRESALDGSIVELLDWRSVSPGDAFYSPAGTLHSIGPGLTLLEIQQNADVTYRLYDFGRPRAIHLDEGVSAAKADLRPARATEKALSEGRSILVQGSKFTVERWRSGRAGLRASRNAPAWLIPLRGLVTADRKVLEQPSVWIAEDAIDLEVSADGELLVAYEGTEIRPLSGTG